MTEEKNNNVDIHGNFDPFDVPKAGRDVRFIVKIPGPEKPMIVKFLRDPRGKQAYVPVDYYKHKIGPDKKDVRFHPCLRSISGSRSPEAEKYYEIRDKLNALGKGAAQADVDKLKAELFTFYPSSKGWFFIVEPASSTIKAVRLPKAVINRLFGKEESQYRPAIPALLKEMGQRNLSPYNLKSNEGWVKIYKTGEGLGTTYTIEMATHETEGEVDGQKALITRPVVFEVHEKIVTSNVTMTDFPDPVDFEQRSAFTMEEAERFTETLGDVVPERFLKNSNTDETDEPAPAGMETAEGSAAQVQEVDDIPL